MKRLSLILLLSLAVPVIAFAQKKPAPAHKPAANAASLSAAHQALSIAYRGGDYAKALKLADDILSKKPLDQKALVLKAMSHGMMGNKEQARQTALEIYPHSKDTAGNFLAVLPLNLSNAVLKRDGAWYVAEGHKLAPSSPIVYMIESSLHADDSLYEKGKAAALAGITLLSDKHPLAVHAQLANLLNISQGKEESYKLMNSLLAKHPEDSALQTTYYAMLMRDKKYNEALTAINSLVSRYPEEKDLRKERAFLYEYMKRHGDACRDAVQLAEEDDTYFALLRKLGCPQAFADLSPSKVKSYTYDVDYHGMKYQFIVEPNSIKMNEGARFNWKMTMRNDMHGSIAITKAALDTAHSQMNMFSAGQSDLDNQTTVWISNAVYRELKQRGRSTITAGEDGPKTFAIVPGDDDSYEPTITNGAGHTRALKTLHVRSEDGAEELWINDDAANPLITRMDIGWSIELAGIE